MAVCLASEAVSNARVSGLVVMGASTTGADSTRPSRRIARFLWMASPETLPSVSMSALLSSRMTECVDPWSLVLGERDGGWCDRTQRLSQLVSSGAGTIARAGRAIRRQSRRAARTLHGGGNETQLQWLPWRTGVIGGGAAAPGEEDCGGAQDGETGNKPSIHLFTLEAPGSKGRTHPLSREKELDDHCCDKDTGTKSAPYGVPIAGPCGGSATRHERIGQQYADVPLPRRNPSILFIDSCMPIIDRSHMHRTAIGTLKGLIVVLIALLLVCQAFVVPAVAQQMVERSHGLGYLLVPGIIITVGFLLCVQIALVCVWRLLSLVRASSIFSEDSFTYVDIILGTVAVATVLIFGSFLTLAVAGVASPSVVILCSLGIVVGSGLTLLIIVMRGLLRKASQLEQDLSEVV